MEHDQLAHYLRLAYREIDLHGRIVTDSVAEELLAVLRDGDLAEAG